MSPKTLKRRLRPEQFSPEDRQALADTDGLTLNGDPAIIMGLRRDFPIVMSLQTTRRVEFAWPTIEHVITNRDGAFQG